MCVGVASKLFESRLSEFLFESPWYRTSKISESTLQLGCGTCIKLCQRYPQLRTVWDIKTSAAGIEKFVNYLQTNHPQTHKQFGPDFLKTLRQAKGAAM